MPFLSSLARNGLFFVLALTVASIPSTVLSQTSGLDPLTGVWGAEVRFGMPVQGELTLDGREGVWRSSIAGFRVAAETNGSDIRFTLPGNIAEFRGNRDTASNTVRGEWIQPGGEILDPQYASPIEFHSIAPSVWRGTVGRQPRSSSTRLRRLFGAAQSFRWISVSRCTSSFPRRMGR